MATYNKLDRQRSKARKNRDMRKTMIVANWKMNIATSEEAERLSDAINSALWKLPDDEVAVAICPPAVWLRAALPQYYFVGGSILVGAQNIHAEESGAFTGEISAEMASDFAQYAIVGHSERRELFGETDEAVSAKVAAAVRAGLRPILCVGEPESVRDSGDANGYVAAQLDAGLSSVEDLSGVAVAYEPVWAIGAGRAATPELAQEMIGGLRESLRARFGDAADETPFLYGGSVNADNIIDFVRQPDIDGALVGSASLEAESFINIVRGAIWAAGINYAPWRETDQTPERLRKDPWRPPARYEPANDGESAG